MSSPRRWQRAPSVKKGRWWARKTAWHRAGMAGRSRNEVLDDMALRFAAQEHADWSDGR